LSIIKLALNLETFGPKSPGQIFPINALSTRKKPILNKTKMKPNETVNDIGMKDSKIKDIADTLNNSYSENYWEKD